ncbi:MAG: rhomboid family intramembrane serine protease [Proteobacteria bacterium]|nr:rhomboid family intramembrane serine protease [Pseudomonadota bacterium]
MYHRQEEAFHPTQLLPLVPQPRGLAFFLGTWTGRLILINTFMFLLTSWQAGKFDLFSMDLGVLIRFGAKDSVLLAQGEYWRYLTPMFLHSGFLHYAFNNWALYVVAYQIEFLLGPKQFLLLYFGAGLAGNITSAVVRSTSISVGASGALFGLFGFGFYLERVIRSKIFHETGTKPKAGAYTTMAIGNIIFGFLIPQIDNSAHIGGLLAAIAFGYIWLRMVPNQLLPLRRSHSRIAAALILVALGSGAALGSSQWYVLYRLEGAIQNADQDQEAYFYLGRLIELKPNSNLDRFQHLTLALRLRDYGRASDDLRHLGDKDGFELRLNELEAELERQGFHESAAWLHQKRQDLHQIL